MQKFAESEKFRPCQSVQVAQADIGQHFSHMHQTPFSQSMAQMLLT